MLVPLRPGELQRLIPAVATSNQFAAALGNPRKILQRVMIAAIGGVITLLISQSQLASRWGAVWLVVGVALLLYVLWGPIVEAGQRNAGLRRYPAAAIFEGEVANVFTRERVLDRHEQANKLGELELVENRRTWIVLELEDEDGYLGQLSFPMSKKHQFIRAGSLIRCLVLSDRKDFSRIAALTDAWLPGQRLWVGEYPFLLRPAFEELCQLRLARQTS
ncbi:hypothetical protein PMIT1342_01746 [Prochlorococcus marinus str. MIT 1342]|uniref:hypothetical protein n=1 Tax=Prochlorococcus TaxID=1218 RepID=UPI0007B323B1|nr:hypothetical protein [Prochlorococcus marinus]KZR81409.1 hypothetical protein PMIT1342_01746 [Prochlorococcus marinus str. MIT 1342]